MDYQKITIKIVKKKRKSNKEIDAHIDKAWNEKNILASKYKRKLWDGVVYRLNGFRSKNNTLELELGETTYKETVGTHEKSSHEILTKFGRDYLANTLVITSSIITKDNKIVFGKRNSGVIESNKIGTFGGSLNKDEMAVTKFQDIYTSLQHELKEELGIYKKEIESYKFLGLAYDYNLYPQLHFQVMLSLAYKELHERFLKTLQNTADEEHSELIWTYPVKNLLKNFQSKNIQNFSGALTEHIKLLITP